MLDIGQFILNLIQPFAEQYPIVGEIVAFILRGLAER